MTVEHACGRGERKEGGDGYHSVNKITSVCGTYALNSDGDLIFIAFDFETAGR